jgi:hypothetical protein
MSQEFIGARFFDERKRDRGWASKVVRRQSMQGRLTVLEVTTNDAGLLTFLGTLDKAPMSVQETGTDGASYRFSWASGYDNGPTVRIQGVLEEVWDPGSAKERIS